MLSSTPPWPQWYRPPPTSKVRARATTAATLIQRVCELTSVTPFEFNSDQRFKEAARARHAVSYVLHHHRSSMTLGQIARATGRKCHSTIRNSLSKAEALRRSDPQFAQLITKLEATIGGLDG